MVLLNRMVHNKQPWLTVGHEGHREDQELKQQNLLSQTRFGDLVNEGHSRHQGRSYGLPCSHKFMTCVHIPEGRWCLE